MSTTNPPPDPARVPDLVSEQDVATLAKSREFILEKSAHNLAASLANGQQDNWDAIYTGQQRGAALMAAELADFHEAAANAPHQSDRSSAYHLKLAGYARQLEALALGELEYDCD